MEWILTPIIGLIVALGIGKLIQMAYAARLERQTVKRDLDQTNSGKAIDADVNAFNSISKRLELVESKLDYVHSQLMDQKVKNAELKSNALHAKEDSERLATEILNLRKRNHDLGDEIMKRDAQLVLLEARILHLESLLAQYQTNTIHRDEIVSVKLLEDE